MSRPYSIYLDPGHGGKDYGAVSADGKHNEKDIVLDIGRLWKRCAMQGDYLYDVFLTRFSDRYLTLPARVKLAEERKVDLFISLHLNSFSGPKPEGVEVWYRSGSVRSAVLATRLYHAVLDSLPAIAGRGVKPSCDAPKGSLYVLDKTTMPAALIEFEFLSNPQEFVTEINVQRPLVKNLSEQIEYILEGGPE